MNEVTTRFKNCDWLNDGHVFTIGGAGSIGSWLCLFLSRFQNEIYVFDNDKFEEHNLGGQFAEEHYIGTNKAESCKMFASVFSKNYKVNPITTMFTEESEVTPICFSCFDNIKARQDMFNVWKNNNGQLFIDGRMSAESFTVYAVTPDKIEMYEKTLFKDEDGEDPPCSYKSTSHCASMTASMMTTLYTNWSSNQVSDMEFRSLPFVTEVNLPTLSFEHYNKFEK